MRARTRDRCRAPRPSPPQPAACGAILLPCPFPRRSTTRSRRSSATGSRRPTRSSTCTAATSRRCRPAGPTPSRSPSPPPRCRPCSRPATSTACPWCRSRGGSSLEGQVLPIHGGISLDTTGWRGSSRSTTARSTPASQPGVTKDGLNAALRERGLFFAVDPGADATIGGMAASGASGTMTVRYGTIRENVLALEVVLGRRHDHPHRLAGAQVVRRLRPDAPVVRLGGHARRHHRADAAGARHPGARRRRACSFPTVRRRRRHGDRDRPARHPGRALRAARRAADGRRQPLLGARRAGRADAVPRVPRLARRASQEQAAHVETIAAEYGGGAFRVGRPGRGALAPLEGAARRLLLAARATGPAAAR